MADRIANRALLFILLTGVGVLVYALCFALLGPAAHSAMAVLVGGVCCLLAGLWFATRLPALRAMVRPIYVARGILAPPDLDPATKSL